MADQDLNRTLADARRIVIKVGTSSLTYATGKLNLARLEKLVREIADIRNQGREILLVTSGAVGAGMGRLGLSKRPRSIPEKQAVAAVGQGILMHMYEKLFAEYGQVVAQVLLTRGDIFERNRYLNTSNALLTLLKLGVVPIINENDTVAVEEIKLKIGDNDTLSALVASLVDADLLILLSDIDGLYTANPLFDPAARLLPVIPEITPEIEQLAGGAGSNMATGGMNTKLEAARIVVNSGIAMVIGNSDREGILHEILAGHCPGTFFAPREHRLQARKRWIAFGSTIQGKVWVDWGAREALANEGKSLLPSGITRVEGAFDAGSVISINDPGEEEIARGITNYSAVEIKKISGKRSGEISALLNGRGAEVIHRDNMALKI